jgi:CDP-diacylglycerol--glycerol-3-phosphate 3-phosphatidyltransferase
MLSHYKASLQGVADPVARVLLRARVRANHLTVLGLGVSILAGWALAQGRLRLGAALLAVAGLFDFFDGSLARLSGQESDFGAFLDSVVDRYSDLVVMLGILLFYHRAQDFPGAAFTMAALVGTVMVSYTKARAQSIGVGCEIGLMERPERLIVLIAGATFHLLTPAMAVLAVLTNTTALQRIVYTRRVSRSAVPSPPVGEEGRVRGQARAVSPAPVPSASKGGRGT